jgi:serine/threonine protein kinase
LSPARDSFYERGSQASASHIDDFLLQEELEAKWILNLSMHFRDRSDREKFFITYAEEPNRWRRVTVSCDYRELSPDSLEADLKTLHYQRDKSARIYEAIRDSLPDIQFYDTVTNLKLQTEDGRLHVHVTEDVNEIIPYPSLSAVDHLPCRKFRESAVDFDSHISGFVYKVKVHNRTYIKKEIPGPDAVEEFLYEINALCQLQDSKSVIQFEGIIVDEQSELIKGLLISYAEQGALVDMLYDYRNTDELPWQRREKWARQIVEGLSEIHEAGFVQGDFTLSNIVIDDQDNAKIIDINRRGCPVGWEPPEFARLIESGQRISIYIGVKSDLFQLGMVLWALAEQHDEPERQERPLLCSNDKGNPIPEYFRRIVEACLSDNPKGRPSASRLLGRFPKLSSAYSSPVSTRQPEMPAYEADQGNTEKETGVDEDVPSRRRERRHSSFSNIQMPSIEHIDPADSYILPEASRGRSPSDRSLSRNRHFDYSPYPCQRSIMSLDDSEPENELASLPASRGTRWEQVYVDGDMKLFPSGCVDIGPHGFATAPQGEPKDVCITAPSAELDLCTSFIESRKSSEDTPLALSTVAVTELQAPSEERMEQQQDFPATPELCGDSGSVGGHARQPSSKASFSDRVHDPRLSHLSNTLAEIENEIALDISVHENTKAEVPAAEEGIDFERAFQPPAHQDSGFNEPVSGREERAFFENEKIRRCLEDDIPDPFGSPRHQDSGFNEPVSGREKRAFFANEEVRQDLQDNIPEPFGSARHQDSGFNEAVSIPGPGRVSFEEQNGRRSFEVNREQTGVEERGAREAVPTYQLPPQPEWSISPSLEVNREERGVEERGSRAAAPTYQLPLQPEWSFHEPVKDAEPKRVSFENEKIRQSLEDNRQQLAIKGNPKQLESERVEGRLWDEKEGSFIREDQAVQKELSLLATEIREDQAVLEVRSGATDIKSDVPGTYPFDKVEREGDVADQKDGEKVLEEKLSSTTIRSPPSPPCIRIPEFARGVPLAVEGDQGGRG